MKSIVIHCSKLNNRDDFFDFVFPQMEAPGWHGRNLDALNDSWVTGGICPSGPPFNFIFRQAECTREKMRDFMKIVKGIAEESVAAHGGQIINDELN